MPENSKAVGRLHVITDMSVQSRYSHSELASMALEGGADVVQYREKSNPTTRAHLTHARDMVAISQRWPGHVLVNDRADVAVGSGAWGLHVGKHDLEPQSARAIIGVGAVLGATANSLQEAQQLESAPINYLGVGPVFPTKSKENAPTALGVEGIRLIVAGTPHPVIAIGSIKPEHVHALLDAGVFGVAGLAGVCAADNPMEATKAYRQAIDSWTEGHGASPT